MMLKVKVIGQNEWHHWISWPQNIDLDTKIVILSALVQKLWSKTSFGIKVANVTRLSASHVQISQDIFFIC